MLEPGGGPGLFLEAAAHLRVADDVGLHDLDDADLVEQAVADAVDRPHAAVADLAEDLVLALEEGSGLVQISSRRTDCRTPGGEETASHGRLRPARGRKRLQ